MNITQKLKIAGFLLNIAEWDRHLEVTRQILNGIDRFEPYAAFLRLTRGRPSEGIDSRLVESFLRENGAQSDSNLIEVVCKIYDTKFSGSLDFEDFLKMTLARDNPKMRFEAAAKREIYDLKEEESLAEEIEYCLARFFSKAADFVKKMKSDAESQSVLADRELFAQLGTAGGCLDFKTLKKYFEGLNIVPKDSELIAILRVIDINDDGIIEKVEFDYFVSLFLSRAGNELLLNKLKEKSRKEHEVNYFGERRGAGLGGSGAKTEEKGRARCRNGLQRDGGDERGGRSGMLIENGGLNGYSRRSVYEAAGNGERAGSREKRGERAERPGSKEKRFERVERIERVERVERGGSRERGERGGSRDKQSNFAENPSRTYDRSGISNTSGDRPERTQYTKTTIVERKSGVEGLRHGATPPPVERKRDREGTDSKSRSRSRNPKPTTSDLDRSAARRTGEGRSGSKERTEVTPTKRSRPEPAARLQSSAVRGADGYVPRERPTAEIVTEEYVSKRTTVVSPPETKVGAYQSSTYERPAIGARTDGYNTNSSGNRHVEMTYSSKKERSPEWSKANKY